MSSTHLNLLHRPLRFVIYQASTTSSKALLHHILYQASLKFRPGLTKSLQTSIPLDKKAVNPPASIVLMSPATYRRPPFTTRSFLGVLCPQIPPSSHLITSPVHEDLHRRSQREPTPTFLRRLPQFWTQTLPRVVAPSVNGAMDVTWFILFRWRSLDMKMNQCRRAPTSKNTPLLSGASWMTAAVIDICKRFLISISQLSVGVH